MCLRHTTQKSSDQRQDNAKLKAYCLHSNLESFRLEKQIALLKYRSHVYTQISQYFDKNVLQDLFSEIGGRITFTAKKTKLHTDAKRPDLIFRYQDKRPRRIWRKIAIVEPDPAQPSVWSINLDKRRSKVKRANTHDSTSDNNGFECPGIVKRRSRNPDWITDIASQPHISHVTAAWERISKRSQTNSCRSVCEREILTVTRTRFHVVLDKVKRVILSTAFAHFKIYKRE